MKNIQAQWLSKKAVRLFENIGSNCGIMICNVKSVISISSMTNLRLRLFLVFYHNIISIYARGFHINCVQFNESNTLLWSNSSRLYWMWLCPTKMITIYSKNDSQFLKKNSLSNKILKVIFLISRFLYLHV